MPNEDKSARYQRLRRRGALAATGAVATLLVVLILSGTAAALADLVARVAGAGVPGIALYSALLVLLADLVQLPFVYYQGVTLEHRFALATHSRTAWWLDHARSLGVSLVLVGGAAIIVVLLMRWSPGGWWLAGGALFALLLVAMTGAAPVVLFPLFYRMTPLDRPALSSRLLALAQRANTAAMGVFEWRLGDRTRKANAALAGLGRTRRILLSDTLLAAHSDEEIEVILAHELAHHVHGDLWTALVVESLSVTTAFYVAHLALDGMAGRVANAGAGELAALPVLAVAVGAVSLLLMPLVLAISRAHERRADRYALEMTQNPAAFVSAIRRLASQNLADERPSPLVEMLFHSHPSTAERIEAARRWAALKQA
jgi:STE24 endopeptidase